MRKSVRSDLYRINADKRIWTALIRDPGFRYIFFWRMATENRGLSRHLFRTLVRLSKSSGITIPFTAQIGDGLRFFHPFAITINSKAKIGKNCTMLKGSTIGAENRGSKIGAPVIGDNVYIGLNSTVVGHVLIGDDVLIAPNTFVNFDVPSHSIVIGCPGVIHSRANATEGYIFNTVEELE